LGTLEKNIHAVTIGEKSYGKGVAQKFVELTDGSALFITYAQIILPDGTKYNKHGIEPKIILKNRNNTQYINSVTNYIKNMKGKL
jgi:carboxyl-terminal processing protease